MARVKGGLFTNLLDVNKRFPLDTRMLVTKRADLINPTIWITNTLKTEATYNGMIVAVNSDGEYNGVYRLTDRTAITQENYDRYLGAFEAGENIEDYFLMWEKLADANELKDLLNAFSRDEFSFVTNETNNIVCIELNKINANKLIQSEGDYLILFGGDASEISEVN